MPNKLFKYLSEGGSIDHLFYVVGRELTPEKVALACDVSENDAVDMLIDYTKQGLLLYMGDNVFVVMP